MSTINGPEKAGMAPGTAPEAVDVPSPEELAAAVEAAAHSAQRQELTELGAEITGGQVDADADAAIAAMGSTPSTTPTNLVEEGGEGFGKWITGVLSGLSSTWTSVSKWLMETGGKFGNWLKGLLGLEKEDEPAVAAAGEKIYSLPELLNPNAPFFTFSKEESPKITSPFGNRDDPMEDSGERQNHAAVDITLAAGNEDIGRPIIATRPLRVSRTGTEPKGGNFIEVEDPNSPTGSLVLPLRHIESLLWKDGDTIPVGAVIAKVGNTGERTTFAHLHVEAKKNGEKVDPTPYLGLA
ncbi:MAG: M23 family metallopeptidase [Candidatus Gracilibacteria bacterium]|jgi:hypothetical protein